MTTLWDNYPSAYILNNHLRATQPSTEKYTQQHSYEWTSQKTR